MGCVPGSSGSGPLLPVNPSGGGTGTGGGGSGGGGGVVMSPCGSGPCLNGGTCVPMARSFMCNCRPGYTGNLTLKVLQLYFDLYVNFQQDQHANLR